MCLDWVEVYKECVLVGWRYVRSVIVMAGGFVSHLPHLLL